MNSDSAPEFQVDPCFAVTKFDSATVISVDWPNIRPNVNKTPAHLNFEKIAGLASVIVIAAQLARDSDPDASEGTRRAALDRLLRGGLNVKVNAKRGQVMAIAEYLQLLAPEASIYIADRVRLWKGVPA